MILFIILQWQFLWANSMVWEGLGYWKDSWGNQQNQEQVWEIKTKQEIVISKVSGEHKEIQNWSIQKKYNENKLSLFIDGESVGFGVCQWDRCDWSFWWNALEIEETWYCFSDYIEMYGIAFGRAKTEEWNFVLREESNLSNLCEYLNNQ